MQLDILALYAQTVGTLLGRKRAEQDLRENEAKLETFFEVLPVGVSILNDDGQIVEMNPALERILGISMDGLSKMGLIIPGTTYSDDGSPMERHGLPARGCGVEKRPFMMSASAFSKRIRPSSGRVSAQHRCQEQMPG